MAYLGNRPAESFASFEKQVFTIVNSQTAYTLSHSVTNENDIRLVVNSVVQEPGSGKAYTASGTTLTLSAALTNGTDTMYCVFLGRALQTVNAPNASVGSSQVSADLITGQTALGATPADTDELLISDAGTLKKIDYSYLKVANTPAFEAVLNADQSYTDNTATKVNFSRETFDTDNCYDNSSNYRFTPTTIGKYFVYSLVLIDVTDLTNKLYTTQISIRKNGSTVKKIDNLYDYSASSGLDLMTAYVYGILDMNGSSDYLEIYAKGNGDQNGNFRGSSSQDFSYFGAYKIIGA